MQIRSLDNEVWSIQITHLVLKALTQTMQLIFSNSVTGWRKTLSILVKTQVASGTKSSIRRQSKMPRINSALFSPLTMSCCNKNSCHASKPRHLKEESLRLKSAAQGATQLVRDQSLAKLPLSRQTLDKPTRNLLHRVQVAQWWISQRASEEPSQRKHYKAVHRQVDHMDPPQTSTVKRITAKAKSWSTFDRLIDSLI